MLDTISIFLNLLRLDLWPKVYPGKRSMCTWEECVFFCIGWNAQKISMRSISSNVSFKICVSLLIFCFDALSIGMSGLLKSPTVIVLLSVSPFMSVSVCLRYWGAPVLGASVQFSTVAQSCPTLCDPMNRSTPGLPVHHQLPEPTQTHVHRVSDAIQPSHPLSSPSPAAPNPSQHQSLFQWVNSSHEAAKVLEFQL